MSSCVVPNISSFTNKISSTLNEQLTTKVIAENWISTEDVAPEKFGSLVTCFEQAGCATGTSYRNKQGFDILNSVHSDQILCDQKKFFETTRFFSVNIDLGTDKGGRPQEATSLRAVDRKTGEIVIHGLGYSQVRHANASCCRDATMDKLSVHGISITDAKKKMICVGADGASTNMGKYAVVKALIQKSSGDKGTNSELEYFGWWWVILFHCINHLLELGLQDLKEKEPFIKEFDEQLKKVFKIYHFSSQMMLDAEDLAKLTDEDFTQLGGLNQIRWAPSQHRAMEKLHANYPILCQRMIFVLQQWRNYMLTILYFVSI